jgi:hypothetical protein
MNHVYKDIFGREIKVGSCIVYAAVDGRSGVLRIGKVIELTESKHADYKTHKKDPKVKVISCEHWENCWRGDKRLSKAVSLGFLDRICIVPEESLSHEYRFLLDNFDKEIIIAAAIKTPEWVHRGRRHGEIIKEIVDRRGNFDKLNSIQGFVTSKDRFLDRKEAAQFAYEIKQTKELKSPLLSEDLW